LDEYAKSRGEAGGGEAGLAGAVNAGDAGTSGNGGNNAGNAGLGNTTGGTSGAAGSAADAGEAGWTGEVVVGSTVPQSAVVLEPVVADGIASFAAMTSYAIDEASAASSLYQAPLFAPYDSTSADWWDNLVAEQTQARVPVVMFPSHGAYLTTATDLTGPDAMNPRRLAAWVSAVDRAGSASLFQAECFVDTAAMLAVKNNFHGTAPDATMDLSVQTDWTNVIWLRMVKPWFDSVPTAYWYQLGGGPVIQFGSLTSPAYSRLSGNLSALLTSVATSFQAAYGTYPSFVLDPTWFAGDSTLSFNTHVIGKNGLIALPSSPAVFASYASLALGTIVPGLADPTYYQVGNANYHEASLLIARKTNDAYSATVSTLLTGLAGAVQNETTLTVLQDFTDLKHWAGFYRSEAADWATPNEYLNLVRRYSDPQTVTLRLEAEGCDRYSDTTTGNSGMAFRRDGDLDVRALSNSSGWTVTNTAAGEWIEFDDVDFSAGNYQFIVKYSTSGTSSSSKRMQLIFDGQALTPIIASNTASADAFANTLLGSRFVDPGTHDLRIRFLDGLLDVDWLFVVKTDPVFSLKSSSASKYVTSTNGGGSGVTVDGAKADVDQRYTFDDINGGTLQDGDTVYLQAYDGLYLNVAATNLLCADHRTTTSADVFTVHNLDTGPIESGSRIALATSGGTHYVTAVSQSVIDASGTAVGNAQTFTLKSY
jgi:hypothetical protein